MIHRLVLFFALLLPIQFAWSAASAYCEHEPASSGQSGHFGHHFHAHKGEPKSKTAPRLAADSDCASCHAASAPAIDLAHNSSTAVPSTALTARMVLPAYSSAPSRVPDRPQWLRLV